jgi:hypothetical protein
MTYIIKLLSHLNYRHISVKTLLFDRDFKEAPMGRKGRSSFRRADKSANLV